MKGKKDKSKSKKPKPASEVRSKLQAKEGLRRSRIGKIKTLAKVAAVGTVTGASQKFGADAYEHVKIFLTQNGPMVAQVVHDGVHQVLRNPMMTMAEYEHLLKQRRRSAKTKTPTKKQRAHKARS